MGDENNVPNSVGLSDEEMREWRTLPIETWPVVVLLAEVAALREIVQAVALYDWDTVLDSCPFCSSTLWEGEPDNHTSACIVSKALALLSNYYA